MVKAPRTQGRPRRRRCLADRRGTLWAQQHGGPWPRDRPAGDVRRRRCARPFTVRSPTRRAAAALPVPCRTRTPGASSAASTAVCACRENRRSPNAPSLTGIPRRRLQPAFLAGPLATMYRRSGRDRRRVERPGRGDDTPGLGPTVDRETQLLFRALNRGKLSVAWDLNRPRRPRQGPRLARRADVLVENFMTGRWRIRPRRTAVCAPQIPASSMPRSPDSVPAQAHPCRVTTSSPRPSAD